MTIAVVNTKVKTTAIGSLPHPNVDSALEYSFRFDIPFLPQLPIRNPREYMIPQSLSGLPGLKIQSGGMVMIDLQEWDQKGKDWQEKVKTAFDESKRKPQAFEDFVPGTDVYSAWFPFLWEIEERKTPLVKIQMAGPLTTQWAVSLSDGSKIEKHLDLWSTIQNHLLARSIAMIRKVRETGAEVLFYLDEPALFTFQVDHPKTLVSFSELGLFIKVLKSEGAKIGLHCCSNTQWEKALALDIDILSLDTNLSLESLVTYQKALAQFSMRGGVLSLGVVPTDLSSTQYKDLNGANLAQDLQRQLSSFPGLISNCIVTPACGMALLSPEDSEIIAGLLKSVSKTLTQ
ncbi:MAG: hypothetical protein KA715_08465 [Xanthomonadaceae bacterium]|nr:hypothetical protein [Xanthomonadaceae bacterium]